MDDILLQSNGEPFVARNKSSIVAHIPVSYVKINRRVLELTEEQRTELSERARNIFHKD